MAKVLGVDFGDRRTGIAISDAARIIAFPRQTLDCPLLEQAAAAVARLAEAEGVTEIVVGLPLNMDGPQTNGFAEPASQENSLRLGSSSSQRSTASALPWCSLAGRKARAAPSGRRSPARMRSTTFAFRIFWSTAS